MSNKRMNYFHKCECGHCFEGFIKQTHCWRCISNWLKAKGYI